MARIIYRNLGRMSELGLAADQPNAKQLAKYSTLKWYHFIEIEMNVPPTLGLAESHPILIERLEADWGSLLSSLECSSGNFRRALHGQIPGQKISLAHVWAEIYSIFFYQVLTRVSYRYKYVNFQERFIPIERERLISRAMLFYSEWLPPELMGFEYTISYYLNAALADEPYNIRRQLDHLIQYRRRLLCHKADA